MLFCFGVFVGVWATCLVGILVYALRDQAPSPVADEDAWQRVAIGCTAERYREAALQERARHETLLERQVRECVSRAG